MANKITLEIETKVLEMISSGMNAAEIVKTLGFLSNTTIKNIADRNGIALNKGKKINEELSKKYDEFEKLIRNGSSINSAIRQTGISTKSAFIQIKKRDLKDFTKNRKEAGLEKRISMEEAQVRLPDQSCKIISWGTVPNKKRPMFTIMAPDGFLFYKTSEYLCKGDPRTKPGYSDPSKPKKVKDPSKNSGRFVSKITPEIESKILELISKGLNVTDISKEIIIISKQSIANWIKRKHINVKKGKNIDQERLKKYDEFERLLKSGSTLTEARRLLGISSGIAQRIVKNRDLRKFVRTIKEAAVEDKLLTVEEANSRIPEGHGKIIDYGTFDKFKIPLYKIQAEDGHIYYKRRSCLHQGDPRGKSGTKILLEDVIEALREIGYRYIDGWTIKRNPIRAEHIECGYIRENRLANFSTQSCPKCNKSDISKEEIEINEWVKSLGFQTEKYKFPSEKTNSKSLDISVIGKSLAIEYNGLYWHSFETLKEGRPYLSDSEIIRYHFDKMILASDYGIRLITIFSHEWKNRQSQVKNYVKSSLGIASLKLNGRDTEVRKINDLIGNEFIEENHIQGSTHISLAYFGIFFEKELVGVMSLGRHHWENSPDTIVLDRLCFKDEVIIHGGASKLFNLAKDWAVSNNYNYIVSWSDNRWSKGAVYQKLGFKLEEESPPDFFYFRGNRVFTRQNLKKTPEEIESKKSYDELREEQGYKKVFDCGKKRWIFELK